MDYQHYTTEDFILDEKFQDWVFYPTPSLSHFWEEFLQNHPERIREVDEARCLLAAIQFHRHEPDRLMQQRIQARLQSYTREASNRQIHRKGITRHISPYWVAAGVAFLLFVGAALWQTAYQSLPVYQTAYAETKEIWLPDSSLVVLNANSSIKVKDYETATLREVWLEGEAFFEVTKNKERPFIVHTEDLQVRVTGTSFNVADRQWKTEVVLATGQVLLEADVLAEPLIMKPGDLVSYDKASRQIQQQEVSPDQYKAWRDRIYFFQEATLQEVAEVIETYYGQEVQLDQNVSELRFTAKVMMHAEVDELLTLLSETFDLTIIKNRKQILIRKEKQ